MKGAMEGLTAFGDCSPRQQGRPDWQMVEDAMIQQETTCRRRSRVRLCLFAC